MGDWLFETLRSFFDEHGYWTVFITLLLENAGVPVPGETVLLFASFLAFSERQLHMPHLILVGILACTIGDNVGYWVGHRGGRRLLERYRSFFHISPETIASGEQLFEKYGDLTIFFARFIFGMRIIAGPLAGVLRMHWRRFFLFNILGASAWVVVITLVGYKFGEHWEHLVKILGRVNLIIALVAAYVGVRIWQRYRTRRDAEREREHKAAADPHA